MNKKARRGAVDVSQHRRGDSMKMKNEMMSYLRMLVRFDKENSQPSLPALLLKKGSWFDGRAGSDEYAAAKKWKKKRKPEAQDCFYNSQEFCTEDNGSRYFEGFVLTKKGMLPPAEHAWIVMQDGRVVDFTLEALEVVVAKKKYAVDTTGALYLGLEIPKAFIAERLNTTGWYDFVAEFFYADQIQ